LVSISGRAASMAIQIVKMKSGQLLYITEYTSFFDKFLGLMFRKEIAVNEGIVFLYDKESIVNATIHMLFMRFPISVVWVNQDNIIVDKALAKPWRLAYSPKKPANTIYEIHANVIDEFQIGDKMEFNYES
jgi:uncharacterized membrane protein (UPF0127 family)